MSDKLSSLDLMYKKYGLQTPGELDEFEECDYIDKNYEISNQINIDEYGNFIKVDCNSCSIEGRINCCKRHPETNEFVTREFSVGFRDVCPNLGLDRLCLIYDSRPPACESFQCQGSEKDLTQLFSKYK